MAKKSADALQKQKDARQKKILFALLPVLLLLLVWQGPGMLKAFSGGTPPPDTAPAPVTPTPTTAAPAPTGAPTTAAAAPAGAAAPGELPDTNEPLTPAAGQLVSFGRFVGKDPFKQQVVAREPTAEEGADASGDGGGDDGSDGAGGGSGTGSDDTAITDPGDDDGGGGFDDGARTSATVDVNGTREEVFVGTAFPAIDPIFRVVTLRAKRATIDLVTGEFSNGAKTLTLRLKKPLTLVSQPDGLRYRITLLATGTNTG